MKNKIKIFFKTLYEIVNRPEMEVLPGHLAFYFMMMLIPLLTLLGSILTNFELVSTSISQVIYGHLPSSIADIVISVSRQDVSNLSLWIILVPTLILASNGTYSMIITSNSVYKVRPKYNVILAYIKDRTKAFIMLVVLIFIFLFLILVPTLGNVIFKIIGNIVTNENIVNNTYYIIFKILKYPVTFLFVFLSIKVLYVMAPDTKIKMKDTNIGAFFTSLTWIIVTLGYSYYIQYFSSYETFYGGLSSLLFLMLWIYLLSYMFVLGIALNASKARGELQKIEENDK